MPALTGAVLTTIGLAGLLNLMFSAMGAGVVIHGMGISAVIGVALQ